VRCLVDAAAARWHLEAGQTCQAEELIATLPDGGPARTLLQARLDLARGRLDAVKARLGQASPGTMRDRLTSELLLARAAIESREDAAAHVTVAVGLAAPEHLTRVFLDEGAAVARLAREAAESLGTESGTSLSVALGSPPPSRAAPRQPAVILTERELLMLRFLPSHLTNAEIARECFHVGEHGQGAPEEHLHQARRLHPRADGRAGPPARPALTGHATPIPAPARRPGMVPRGTQPTPASVLGTAVTPAALEVSLAARAARLAARPPSPAPPAGQAAPGACGGRAPNRPAGPGEEHLATTAEPPQSPVTEGVRSLEVRWMQAGQERDDDGDADAGEGEQNPAALAGEVSGVGQVHGDARPGTAKS
jgi:hypothetical protein